eukprot:COSAG06_NODE_5258_length_3604_cov_147.017689_2_plen_90_part_00
MIIFMYKWLKKTVFSPAEPEEPTKKRSNEGEALCSIKAFLVGFPSLSWQIVAFHDNMHAMHKTNGVCVCVFFRAFRIQPPRARGRAPSG